MADQHDQPDPDGTTAASRGAAAGGGDQPKVIYAMPAAMAEDDDGVSLAELGDRVRARWLWVFSLLVLGALAGAAWGLLREPVYHHEALLQVGENAEGELVEDPAPIRTRLVHAYLPEAWGRLRAAAPELGSMPELQIELPEGEGLLLLQIQAPESRTPAVIAALEQALGRVVASLASETKEARTRLQADLLVQRRRLAELEDRRALLEEHRDRLEAGVAELEEQLAELEAIVGSEGEGEPGERWQDKEAALALLLQDRQVDRRRYDQLRQRLALDIPEKRIELALQRSEIESRISEVQGAIERIEARSDALRPTEVLAQPTRRSEPLGLPWRHRALLGAVLAALTGLALAVLAGPPASRRS